MKALEVNYLMWNLWTRMRQLKGKVKIRLEKAEYLMRKSLQDPRKQQLRASSLDNTVLNRLCQVPWVLPPVLVSIKVQEKNM
jgi:hypothetical protein